MAAAGALREPHHIFFLSLFTIFFSFSLSFLRSYTHSHISHETLEGAIQRHQQTRTVPQKNTHILFTNSATHTQRQGRKGAYGGCRQVRCVGHTAAEHADATKRTAATTKRAATATKIERADATKRTAAATKIERAANHSTQIRNRGDAERNPDQARSRRESANAHAATRQEGRTGHSPSSSPPQPCGR